MSVITNEIGLFVTVTLVIFLVSLLNTFEMNSVYGETGLLTKNWLSIQDKPTYEVKLVHEWRQVEHLRMFLLRL